jgi:hypothetical protein
MYFKFMSEIFLSSRRPTLLIYYDLSWILDKEGFLRFPISLEYQNIFFYNILKNFSLSPNKGCGG